MRAEIAPESGGPRGIPYIRARTNLRKLGPTTPHVKGSIFFVDFLREI